MELINSGFFSDFGGVGLGALPTGSFFLFSVNPPGADISGGISLGFDAVLTGSGFGVVFTGAGFGTVLAGSDFGILLTGSAFGTLFTGADFTATGAGAPHFAQNFAFIRNSAPHFLQNMSLSPLLS